MHYCYWKICADLTHWIRKQFFWGCRRRSRIQLPLLNLFVSMVLTGVKSLLSPRSAELPCLKQILLKKKWRCYFHIVAFPSRNIPLDSSVQPTVHELDLALEVTESCLQQAAQPCTFPSLAFLIPLNPLCSMEASSFPLSLPHLPSPFLPTSGAAFLLPFSHPLLPYCRRVVASAGWSETVRPLVQRIELHCPKKLAGQLFKN